LSFLKFLEDFRADIRMTRMFKIRKFEFPEVEDNGDYGLARAVAAEKAVKTLGRIVNEFANTDHQKVRFFPLTCHEGKRGFMKHKNCAKIGYMFDTNKREVYLAFNGQIDATLAYEVLLREGYDVEETDESFDPFISEITTKPIAPNWAYARLSEEELTERQVIEERHAHNDIYCR